MLRRGQMASDGLGALLKAVFRNCYQSFGNRAISALNFLRRVRAKGRRLYRRHVRDPEMEESLRYFHGRDPKENNDTTPPEDEVIDLICLWAVEFYAPAQTDSLVENLIGLGWGKDDRSGSLSNPIAWIEGLRSYHQGMGMVSLGLLAPSNSQQSFVGPYHKVPLPPDVQYATAGIYSLTPSLVCVVVCFVFESHSSRLLDKALRTDRSTYMTRTKSGWRFHLPTNQKMDAVKEIRRNMSKLASDWFCRNLPGLFSSGILNGEVPTCELITTRVAEPFPSRSAGQSHPFEYPWVLGIGPDFDVWQYENGMKLSFPSSRERDPRYHAILVTRESAPHWQANEPSNRGMRDSLHKLDLVIPGVLSGWAIVPMLEGYTRHIREIRDSTKLRPKGRPSSLRILESVGNYISYSVDVSAVAGELTESSNVMLELANLYGRFEYCGRGLNPEESLSLDSNLNHVVSDRANWLLRTDEVLRDQLTQYGSLLGAAENVRLQKKIGCLTLILVAFGVVTLLLSALALFQSLQIADPLPILKELLGGTN